MKQKSVFGKIKTKIKAAVKAASIGSGSREYKDGIFRDCFNYPPRLCSLSNALLEINATAQQIVINTLENELFHRQRNDVSCIINNQVLVAGEHQSWLDRGIVFRMLRYLVCLWEKAVSGKNATLPIPRLFVLYNGHDKLNAADDDKITMTLPYRENPLGGGSPDIVVTVTVYNINRGRSPELMARCQPLKEYAEFIGAVRDNEAAGLARNAAIAKAVRDCKTGEMADYFRGRKIERVIDMLTLDLTYEEGIDDAVAQAAEKAAAEARAQAWVQATAETEARMRAEMLQALAQKDQEAAKAQREKEELQRQLDELKRQSQAKSRDDNNSRGGWSR